MEICWKLFRAKQGFARNHPGSLGSVCRQEKTYCSVRVMQDMAIFKLWENVNVYKRWSLRDVLKPKL